MEFLTTINDHLKGKSKASAGAQSVLTASEEKEIALTCKTLADMSQENWCRWSFMTTYKTTALKILSLGECQGKIGGSTL